MAGGCCPRYISPTTKPAHRQHATNADHPPAAVLGVDLSLAATGLAHPDGTTSVVTSTGTGTDRLVSVRHPVLAAATGVDLVVVEGPAFGRAQGMHLLGQLAGIVYLALDEAGIAWSLVPPASVKRYATGRGNAGKAEVLAAAICRLGYPGHDDNEPTPYGCGPSVSTCSAAQPSACRRRIGSPSTSWRSPPGAPDDDITNDHR